MAIINLGPNGHKVNVPDELLAKYDSGTITANGLKDYAISNNLATPEQVGLPSESKANPPEVSGPMEAAMIAAGREVYRTGSNVAEAAAELSGNPRRAQEERDYQEEQARLAEPVREQFPKSSIAGEVIPGFAIPGGKVAQLGAAAALGALEGDTLGERVFNASLSAGFALGGQKLGEVVGAQAQRGLMKFSDAARARSLRIMHDLNIPTTLGQRGSPVARFFERMQSTITGNQPLYSRQIRALNRLALKAIGETGERIDDVTLSRAHTRIGQTFERAAQEVQFIPSDNAVYGGIKAIERELADVGTDSARVQRAFDRVKDAFFESKMTSERYLDLRTKLGKLSSELWENGAKLDASYVDETIQVMDDAFARNAPPEFVSDLVKAGREWRFLTALRRGSSISPQGDVNINSLNRSLTAKFPGYDVGKGAAGELGQGVRAMRDVVVPFRSSGTAERLVPVGAAGVSVITPQNAGRLAMALAAPFSGGGAAAQAGGNTGRELAMRLIR